MLNRHAGCAKRPGVSPAQPRRAKTRRSAGKAAGSEEANRRLFSPAHPSPVTGVCPGRTVSL